MSHPVHCEMAHVVFGSNVIYLAFVHYFPLNNGYK